jgi:hypothetical protein
MLTPTLCEAYVGPGAGLSILGSVFTFLGAIILLFIGFLWFPIKRLIQRLKSEKKENMEKEPDDGSND